MFTPQRYMTLTVNHEQIQLCKCLFGMTEESYHTLRLTPNYRDLIAFFDRYKNDTGILIENNKMCIEVFQEMIDDGEPIPGYVILFEDFLFFLLTQRNLPNGIKRVGEEPVSPKGNDNVVKLPDIRKLLERV